MRTKQIRAQKYQKTIHLVPAAAPSEFVSSDILCEPIKTSPETHFLIFITDRLSKKVRTL